MFGGGERLLLIFDCVHYLFIYLVQWEEEGECYST